MWTRVGVFRLILFSNQISSLTEGNISRTEVKHTIDNTLNKLQDFSQNNEHSSSDLDSSINLIDKILDVSETANVSLPQTVCLNGNVILSSLNTLCIINLFILVEVTYNENSHFYQVVVKTIDNLLAEKHVTAWQNTSSKPVISFGNSYTKYKFSEGFECVFYTFILFTSLNFSFDILKLIGDCNGE